MASYSGLPAYSAARRLDVEVVETSGGTIDIIAPAAGAVINTNRPVRIIWTDSNALHSAWSVTYRVGAGEWLAIAETTMTFLDWIPPAWSAWPAVQLKVMAV